MACTMFSVVSLVILITTSFLANMNANTQTSSTTRTTTFVQSTMKTSSSTPMTSSSPSSPSIQSSSSSQSASSSLSPQPVTEHGAATESTNSSNNCSSDAASQRNNVENGQVSPESNNCSNDISTEDPLITTVDSNTTDSRTPVRRTYRDYPEFKQYKNLQDWIPYVTTVPGLITNPLTIIIALKIKPMHTSELYMITLGFADMLGVTSKFIYRLVERFAEKRYSWECKLLWYTVTVSLVYSNLVLMSWTVERFIAVIFPMKLGLWCSMRNTKIALCLLLLFDIAVSIPTITELDSLSVWNGRTYVSVCMLSEFISLTWIHIESAYYIYIPVVVVAVCNIFILCRLNAMMKIRISLASNQDTIDKKTKENRRMTILLLSVSVTFLVLHIPYLCGMVLDYLYPDYVKLVVEDPPFFAKLLLYTSLAYVLTEFQNCMNFFLYCLSGTKFRTMLCQLFCKCTSQKPVDTLQTSKTDTTKI